MSSSKQIAIVGGGLAGCLLSIFLSRRGYRVSILEARPDFRKGEVSGGRSINLSLSSRGIKALRAAGVFSKVEPHLVAMPGRMIHPLGSESFFQAYGSQPHEIHYSLSRGGLNQILLREAEKAGAKIKFEHLCEGFDFEKQNLVVRDQKSGKQLQQSFSKIIACDGAGSVIRRRLAKEGFIESQEELLGHSYKELLIPADDRGNYRLKKEALHIWPRGQFMLIALPNRDGSFTVTLFLPNKGEPSFESLDSSEKLERFFKKEFSNALPLIPKLQRDFFSNPTGTLGTIRSWPWHYEDKILIFGDAAHAVVPFHGQGMNCAFEDCLVLDQLLERVSLDEEELFIEFEKLRKKNADAIAEMALENYVEMRDSVGDPLFHQKKKLEWQLEGIFPKHFKSRYSMVMFYPEISYAEAFERGKRQEIILKKLLESPERIKDEKWLTSLVVSTQGAFNQQA